VRQSLGPSFCKSKMTIENLDEGWLDQRLAKKRCHALNPWPLSGKGWFVEWMIAR